MKNNQLIFYSTPNGNVKVEVFYEGETFWLTQKAMSSLFAVAVPAISKHLKNIFDTKELDEDSVVSKMETTATDGKKYLTSFYRLEAILAVGYRVNSSEATQFRIWATNTLKEFIIKGFVLDDERLKQGKNFGKDYFDELLERMKDWSKFLSSFLQLSNYPILNGKGKVTMLEAKLKAESVPIAIGIKIQSDTRPRI